MITDTKYLRELLVVSQKCSGFPSLGVQNIFLFKVKLLVLSNSALPERENPGNVLLTSRICLKYFYQCSEQITV